MNTFRERLGGLGRRRLILGAVAVMVALLLPHIPSSDAGFFSTFSPGNSNSILPIFTIVLCAVYALFALGLNVVVGFAGLLDLGYVAFFLVGAYVAAWLMSGFFYNVKFSFLSGAFKFDGQEQQGIHLTFWLVVIIAAVVAALVGVVIGAPTLRLKSDYLALVTLGFGEILPEVFRNAEPLTNGTKGIGPLDQIGTGPLAILPGFNKRIGPSDYIAKYYVILIFLAIFAFISVRLRDGKLGRAWMAIREDELAASLMGVPLMKTKLWSYAVGAMAGGVGGAFYATIVGTINVDSFTFQLSIIILCAVILGGMGNVWGAILGGTAITWVNYTGLIWVGRSFNSVAGTKVDLVKYQFGFFGLVLVLMMLFRPEGFIPAARSKAVKQSDEAARAAELAGGTP